MGMENYFVAKIYRFVSLVPHLSFHVLNENFVIGNKNDSRNFKLFIAFLRLTTKDEENNNIIYTDSVIYDTRTNYSVDLEEGIAFRKSDIFTHLVNKVKFISKRWEE